jgi:hypothetical protein
MKIINIDGGIGRVITALPALLKYHQNHSTKIGMSQLWGGIIFL